MSERIRRIQREACPGCRNDRYNHPGMCERPGIDAVVTSAHCFSVPHVKYDRKAKRFRCPVNTRERGYHDGAEGGGR